MGVLVALRKQKVSVVITKGVQTKVDHKALPIDDLVSLENGVFNKAGRIDKRKGFTKVNQSSASLIAYKDKLISRNTRTTEADNSAQASVYSKTNSDFRGRKGWSSGLRYTSMAVSKGSSYHQKDPHVSVSNNGRYALVTYLSVDYASDNVGTTGFGFKGKKTKRCSLIDRESGTVIASDVSLGDTSNPNLGGHRMRSVWAQNKFYIFGEDYDGSGTGLYAWTIDPSDDPVVIRDVSGSALTDGVGTLIGGSAAYPLSSGSTFPYDSAGASFDICNGTGDDIHLIKTLYQSSNTYVAYYTYDTSSSTLSYQWMEQISAHSTSVPTYYTIYRQLSDDKLYLSYVDGDTLYIKKTDESGSSATAVDSLVYPGGSTDFYAKCSFLEGNAYVSKSHDVGGLEHKTGIVRFDYSSGTSVQQKIATARLALAMADENDVDSQSGPNTVGGYSYDPTQATFSNTNDDLSVNFLDTVKLWTETEESSVIVNGVSHSGKRHLHDRDYLSYGTLDTELVTDSLEVATPKFLSTTESVLKGHVVAVPVGTNYRTFETDQVLNSVIHLYDFRKEDASNKPAPSSAILQEALYVADEGLFMYDSDRFNLHGITQRPWIGYNQAGGVTGGNSGNLETGTYQYKGTFEWEDALGDLHQTEPTGILTKSTSDDYAPITYPANELITDYTSPTDLGSLGMYNLPEEVNRDVRFAIYRTQEDGSTYNLNWVANAFHRTYAAKTFVDQKSDEINSIGRFLYTDTGELVNTPPPSPAIYVAAHKNRLFIIGKDRRVYYSKLAIPGYGLAFNPALEVKLPNSVNDKPVALGSMDGSMVIFTEKSIYHVTGEGPDNLGEGGFYEPKKIPSVAGASEGTPVRLMDKGLIFTNESNVYILGRDSKITDLGSPAHDMLDGKRIIDIRVDEDEKVVYFQTNSQTSAELITYNFLFGQWGKVVINGETSIDSIERHGDGVAVSCGSNTYFSSDSYKDDTLYNSLKLRTAWIKLDTYKGVHKFSSLQGYQRVYNFQILGECKDPHTLKVNVYYDYDDGTIVDTHTKEITETGKLQVKGHLSKQKCNAVQFEIYDESSSSTSTGEGFTITHIELEIGQKMDQYRDGVMKISSSKMFS